MIFGFDLILFQQINHCCVKYQDCIIVLKFERFSLFLLDSFTDVTKYICKLRKLLIDNIATIVSDYIILLY